jgi:phosphonoacetate hydrolase
MDRLSRRYTGPEGQEDMPYLLTPGPLTTSRSVKATMLADWGSRDVEFRKVVAEIREGLLALAGCDDSYECVIMQGSGTFAIEAALGCFCPAEDGKTLVVANGAYGDRAAAILMRIGRPVAKIDKGDSAAPSVAEIAEYLDGDPTITHVWVIHCETTSGIVNPIHDIASAVKARGKVVMVDAMSSFGALPLHMGDGIDVMVSSSNKCIEGVPGFSYVLVKRGLLEASKGKCHSVVLDLFEQWKGLEANGQFRFTPPTHALVAFHQAMKEHAKEGGVAARGARYARNAALLITGMREMGFSTLLSDNEAGPIIQTFLTPRDPNFDFEHFYEALRVRGFAIYPGKLTRRPSFRIGTIGKVDEAVMKGVLRAIRDVLAEMNVTDLSPLELARKPVKVNGRSYDWPKQPLVVVCCDGSEPDYMEIAMREGLMPNLQRIIGKGENRRGLSVIPSFTNPNNLSIVTGRPPNVHGICGNYLIDPASGQETMMNDPKWLRAPTIFEAFQKEGAKVAVVTAKDKLRLLLSKGLVYNGTAVAFSSEKADQATLADNGIADVCAMVGRPVPDVYSADLSEFVFAAGVKLLHGMRPDLMYLSTTDYIQHKFAPGSGGANAFYAMMDTYLGEFDKAGATIIIVADHGMKDKHLENGEPDVIYLQDVLDARFGEGTTKVILPITDPYVVHHGALGSFATVYVDGADADAVIAEITGLDGIDAVHTRAGGCARFELPEDRMGDIIVLSGGPKGSKVIGTSRGKHDLSGLNEPLRSHGGLTEQEIPVISNRKLKNLPAQLRNFDAFALGCNHVVEA